MNTIEIYTDYIKLDQSLKLAGVIGQGSDAKILIHDGMIKVNDEICTMRGKKLRSGDVVSVENGSVFMVVNQNDSE